MRVVAILLVILMVGGISQARAGTQPLVDLNWLITHLDRPGTVIVDTRSRAEFEAAHIPGAVHTDYGRDGWRATNAAGIPGMFPDAAARLRALADRIGRLGIGNDTHVVLIPRGRDASDLGVATRIYWTSKVLGHDAVSILDGGMAAYTAAEGKALSREMSGPEPRAFAVSLRRDMLLNQGNVRQAMRQGSALIDSQPPEQFQGRTKSPVAARAGTIPGARSVPAASLTNAGNGTFQSTAALAELFGVAGVDSADAMNPVEIKVGD